MSVNSVEKNRQDTQNIADTYEEREKNLIARQKRQAAETARKHQETVKEISDRHTEQIGDLQRNSRNELTSKERQHVKEMNDLKDASRKKLMATKVDDDERNERNEKTFEGELHNQRKQAASDKARLTKNFDEGMRDRDNAEAETEEHYRKGSQSATREKVKELQKNHEKELSGLNELYQNNLEGKENELTKTRRQMVRETNDLKDKNVRDNKNSEHKYNSILTNERNKNAQNMENLSEGFKIALDENKDRYRTIGQKKTEEFDQNFANLKKTVDNRVNTDVREQKAENENLRSQHDFEKAKARNDFELQKTNLINEYKKNHDELEMRRQEAVKDGNRQKREEIEELQLRQSRAYQKMNEEHLSAFNDLKNKIDSQYMGQVQEAEREKNLSALQSEQKRKKLAQNYSESLLAASEFHEDAMDAQKRSSHRLMDDQRAILQKARNSDVNGMRDQLLKQSVDHQEKLATITEKYESQISSMRADYEKRMRRQSELFRDATEKQSKYLAMDREASDSKLQNRLSQTKEAYEKEIEQLKRKHAAEKEELATSKKTT